MDREDVEGVPRSKVRRMNDRSMPAVEQPSTKALGFAFLIAAWARLRSSAYMSFGALPEEDVRLVPDLPATDVIAVAIDDDGRPVAERIKPLRRIA